MYAWLLLSSVGKKKKEGQSEALAPASSNTQTLPSTFLVSCVAWEAKAVRHRPCRSCLGRGEGGVEGMHRPTHTYIHTYVRTYVHVLIRTYIAVGVRVQQQCQFWCVRVCVYACYVAWMPVKDKKHGDGLRK